MIAYKGFNHDFTCTQGKGVFQYEVGKTYTESDEEIKTRKTGFHATIEPLQVLFWYGQSDARFAKVFTVQGSFSSHIFFKTSSLY